MLARAAAWHSVCSRLADARSPFIFREPLMQLKGKHVCFSVRDIYFPAPGVVLDELHGNDLMSGQVVEVSDSGHDPQAYVIVKVSALADPVIVAVDRLRDSSDPEHIRKE